jgi:uncharacterized protein YoxC
MAGIFGNDFRLQRENERLKRELAREKADNAELLHQNAVLKEDVSQWKAYGQNLGGYGQTINAELKHLREQVQCLADSQERNFKAVSDQLTELNTALDEVDSAVTGLGESITTETQQVIDELNRLNNQNPSVDLSPVIARVTGFRDKVNQDIQNVNNIIADAVPEPAPGSKRQK